MVNVTKADGSQQVFDREKVKRTCLRLRVSENEAEEITQEIERGVHEGIRTKQILKMVFTKIRNYKPKMKHAIDLREAIGLLRSKPDFEHFVGELLRAEGYEILNNQILNGKCVDHEIDVIAKKRNEVLYVEVKHHSQFHTYTGLDVLLEANSAFEDLVGGFHEGKHNFAFDKAYVVLNTKVSEHAKRYSSCRGIGVIAWKMPQERGLEFMIEEKRLYPITSIKNLDRFAQESLGDRGIVTLKQLQRLPPEEIVKLTGIPQGVLEDLIFKAGEILNA